MATSAQPFQPFWGQRADEIGVVLAALVPTLLNGDQAITLGKANGGLSEPAADACAGGDAVDEKSAHISVCDLIADDPAGTGLLAFQDLARGADLLLRLSTRAKHQPAGTRHAGRAESLSQL